MNGSFYEKNKILKTDKKLMSFRKKAKLKKIK